MVRRRTTTSKSITHEKDIVVDNGDGDDYNCDDKLYRKNLRLTSKIAPSFASIEHFIVGHPIVVHLCVCVILLIRSYVGGITAAGSETWYPVPLIGYVRSELALLIFLFGSVPFLILVLGWTYIGVTMIVGLAIYIPQLVMPGPIPIPVQAYQCFGIIYTILGLIVLPFWKKPQASVVAFAVIAIMMPNLPDIVKPLYSAVPVEYIPYQVTNLKPDILEEVGAAALESGPLLDFVWENRNNWVHVSHGRAMGYFVFG